MVTMLKDFPANKYCLVIFASLNIVLFGKEKSDYLLSIFLSLIETFDCHLILTDILWVCYYMMEGMGKRPQKDEMTLKPQH